MHKVRNNNTYEKEQWYGNLALTKESKIKKDLPQHLGSQKFMAGYYAILLKLGSWIWGSYEKDVGGVRAKKGENKDAFERNAKAEVQMHY